MTGVIDIVPIALFLGLTLGSWFKRLSFKFSIGAGVVLLVCAAIISVGDEPLANQVAILAYYTLLAGVILALLTHVKKKTETEGESPGVDLGPKEAKETHLQWALTDPAGVPDGMQLGRDRSRVE